MPPIPVWARAPFVLSAIVAYLAVHFAVRMTMWHTLGFDDAEQALFAQKAAWSYRNSAPPLFTWLLLGLGKVAGVSIVSISILRYALLGLVFGFSYLAARRLIADPRLAALSVYSFAAIYVFAFYSHHDLTHTTIMSAMLAVAWYVFVRLAESPRLGWYVALGAVFGLGLLGKWNFVMFAAALPLACLFSPAFRPLILTWKIVPAFVVCGLIVLPTVATVLLIGPTGRDTFRSVLVGDGAPYIARVAEGTMRLVKSALAYPQPLLPLVVLVFALPLWRGLRAPASNAEHPPYAEASRPPLRGPLGSHLRVRRTGPRSTLRPDAAFLGWTMAISLALHLALVVAFGARQFSERLMQPPLYILPIFLFMLIERGRPSARAVNAFALILMLLVSGALAARIAVYLRGADHCGSCRNMMPVEALAAELRAAGFTGSGTILAGGFHIGGNMRVAFPAARVVDPAYPRSTWPSPRDKGGCLLLWQEHDDPAMSVAVPRDLLAYLADKLDGEVDAPHRNGLASAPMFGSETRLYRLAYRLYEDAPGDCR